jgi:hypothetical protein
MIKPVKDAAPVPTQASEAERANAAKVLDNCMAWFAHNEDGTPEWFDYGQGLEVNLDGSFTREQLLAILTFCPEAK